MSHFSIGLRARILLLVSCAIFPAIAVIANTAFTQRQQAAAKAARDSINLVRVVVAEQRRLIASTRQLLIGLSKLPDVRQHASEKVCRATLIDVLKPFPHYRNLGVALPDGTVFCRSHSSTAKVNISDRGYFIRAVQSRDFGIGDFQIGRVLGSRGINFGQAILDAQGEVLAVVFCGLDLNWLNQLVSTYELPEGSVFMLIDSGGTVLIPYSDSEKSEKLVGKSILYSALFKTILATKQEGTAEVEGSDGVTRLYAFAPLHSTPTGNIYVSVGVSTETAMASVNKNLAYNAAVLALAILFATISAWLGADIFVIRRLLSLKHMRRALKMPLTNSSFMGFGKKPLPLLGANCEPPPLHVQASSYEFSAQFKILQTMAWRAMSQKGFRWHATIILLLSFMVFTAVMAIVSPMLAARAFTSSELAQGMLIATSFAQASAPTLRYANLESGKRLAANTVAFPDIVYVALYDNKNTRILTDGTLPEPWYPETSSQTNLHVAKVSNESSLYWHIVAPVFANPFETGKDSIGYVHIVRSKASVNRLHRDLTGYILGLACASLVLALLIFLPMVNRFLRPVRRISDTLERAVIQPGPIRVMEDGPIEITKMVKAFNTLMALVEERDQRLNDHSRLLESQIHLRTQEATQARDLAIAASQHKSEFLATVSHELRTPLQAIIGYTEIAIDDLEADTRTDAVNDLKLAMQAANQLSVLINDILDFAKIEADKVELTLEQVNVQDLAREVIETIAPLVDRARNELKLVIRCERLIINTDRGKARQIILNLLSNACKFTKEGSIVLSIDCTEDETIIAVSDTGPGIAKREQTIIFEAFRQTVHGSRLSGSTGLGLAIAKRYCTLLGGTIEVESEIGQGSIFIVRLPLNISLTRSNA